MKTNQLEEFCLKMLRQCLGPEVAILVQDSTLPGTPDFSVPALRLAIFVDGDWYHDTGGKMTRAAMRFHVKGEAGKALFWSEKALTNKARDREVNRRLKSEFGYRVLRLKEHRLNGLDPLAYVSRALGMILLPKKEKTPL